MSFIQMESLVDLRHKNPYSNYRRNIVPLAVVTATAVLTLVLLIGLFHFDNLPIALPTTTSISVRPDFAVSTYNYERGAFSWFIGVAVSVISGAVAFASIGVGCAVVTGGTAIAGCTLGAVGAALTVVATVQSTLTERRLRLAQQSMIYMDYADKSAKRDEMDDHRKFLDSVFGSGSNYQYAGNITSNSTHNAHLVAKNGGNHVPVFSFTTPHGTPLHHVVLSNHETGGGNFHRFGFNPSNGTTNAKRASTDSIADVEEYFTSGGIDILDCWAGDSNHLSNTDAESVNMQTQIQCEVPNFDDATELAVQVYDSTTEETIAAGRVAPFDASGDSQLIDNTDFADCPTALPTPNSCGQEDDSD